MNKVIDFKWLQNEQKAFVKHLESNLGMNTWNEDYNVPQWIVLALQSELAEILNASKVHKWWSSEEVDREHLIEECADFMAHLGNLANFLGVDLVLSVEEIQKTCLESQFNYLAYKITTLPWNKRFAKTKLINNLLPNFIQLVYSLGFDMDELEAAYRKKLETNYKRFI